VGFETTAPTVAAALLQAEAEGLPNFYLYSVHKLTPPATRAILDGGRVKLDGILGPGHVTAIIGADGWQFLPHDYGIPCAVAGFEPLDILLAVSMLVDMVEEGAPAVGNAYERGVNAQGNQVAQGVLSRVFEIAPARWRGLGSIPDSGLAIAPEYAHRDAATRYAEQTEVAEDAGSPEERRGCRCGEVLRGELEPVECPLFRRVCTPRSPVGPCMVSNEGACAAYYRYGAEA
jgi:hydrogenase expression/formation protein HypD